MADAAARLLRASQTEGDGCQRAELRHGLGDRWCRGRAWLPVASQGYRRVCVSTALGSEADIVLTKLQSIPTIVDFGSVGLVGKLCTV